MLLRTILTTPEYLGMIILVGGAAAVLLYIAWRCLNGDTRTWAAMPAMPFQVSTHNVWPFMLLMFGIFLLTVLPSVFFEAARMETARVVTWGIGFVPLAFVVLSFVWWPLAWAPRWFRDWAARDSADATPWSEAEIERVKAAPDSRRRNRALRDIARVAGEEHVAGLVPDGALDRIHDHAQSLDEKHGITEGMGAVARARIIKANRARWKAEKRQRRNRGNG